jgi:uncharacterized SAM-binding protein YcdF (DUF218 family)
MSGRRLAQGVGVIAAAWLAGFVWFIVDATSMPSMTGSADGIVALTGGADRVTAAMRLLQQGKGRMLLISGVGPGASLASLARESDIDASFLRQDITLGRRATTTVGNASETAAWASRNGLRSLIVVTAFYHMPRALIELGRDMPAARLYPAPVMPGALWRNPAATMRLLAGEYAKFLMAASGLSRLGHAQGAA